jgi:malonate decarboxylase gamma subunit
VGRTAVGVDEAIELSSYVLDSLAQGSGPIFVLVDSDSQRMSKRDELLGLNEFLAHLAKSLIYADMNGRPTIGILYGHSAAGALLATGLATRVLVGVPGATPAVMDAVDGEGHQAVDGNVRRRRSRPPCSRRGLSNLLANGCRSGSE